jgi:hypothetical protein
MSLHNYSARNGQGTPAHIISGVKLARVLKDASSEQRAQAAADIATGQLVVTPLPVRFCNRLAGANQSDAARVRSRRGPPRLRGISDDELDYALLGIGVDRVIKALDRLGVSISA